MPNKKFNLVFDASMNISQVKAAVGEIQKSLSGVSMPQNISTRFTKTFEKLNQEIANFEQQAAKGLTEIGDFKNITKAGQNILKYYQDIQATVRQLGNLSDKELAKLFPADVSAKIEKANKAMQKYNDTIKDSNNSIEKQNTKINRKKKSIENLENKLKKLNETENVISDIEYDSFERELKKAKKEATDLKREMDEVGSAYQKALAIKNEKENRKGFDYKKSTNGPNSWAENTKIVEEYNKKLLEAETYYEKLQEAQKKRISRSGLQENIENTTNNINKAKLELEDFQKELLILQSKSPEAFSKLIEELGKIEGIDITKLQNIDDVATALSNLNTEALEQVQLGVKDLEQNVFNATPAFSNLANNIDTAEASLKQFNARTQEIEGLKQQITYFFGLSNSIELFKRAVRSAYETVKELDEVMTQTAVVTDFTVGDMWSQLPEYTKRANELGVAVKGAYESATLYYQQGLDTNEVVAVSSETLKMARIAGMDYADATNYMTAALRGFNMEINETNAQRINDVYSELAAITASDTQEIATAMTKTASIASNAGMEFETTAAFLSQIIETTREAPETAGTALKTVIARFQELKKDPLEIGEVDGEVVDANKIETALRTIDVALRDTNGQFRDLDDVFLDIAQKWDGLDTNTQRYIATMAAGSRQQSRFIAMMSDYARTMELVNAANNSTGASQQQFEKTLDSLESKLAKLDNAWNEFTMGLTNNEAIKLGVDTLTLLLNIVNDLTGILPEGIDGIAKLGIALLGLHTGGKIFDNFFLNLKTMGPAKASVVSLGSAFKDFGKVFNKNFWVGKDGIPVTNAIKDYINFLETGNDVERGVIEAKQALANAYGLTNQAAQEALQLSSLGINKDVAAMMALDGLTEAQLRQNIVEKYGNNLNQIEIEQKAKLIATTYAQENAERLHNIQKKNGILITISETTARIGESIAQKNNIANLIKEKLVTKGLLSTKGAYIALSLGTAAAIAGVVAGLVLLYKTIKNNSPEEKLKRLQESTEKAKNAAQDAKNAYADLLSSHSEYEELQNNLEGLIKGTKDYEQALFNANQQVLELLQNSSGLKIENIDGKLVVTNWEEVESNQRQGVINTTIGSAIANARDEQFLLEQAFKEIGLGTILESEDDSGNYIRQQLIESYQTEGYKFIDVAEKGVNSEYYTELYSQFNGLANLFGILIPQLEKYNLALNDLSNNSSNLSAIIQSTMPNSSENVGIATERIIQINENEFSQQIEDIKNTLPDNETELKKNYKALSGGLQASADWTKEELKEQIAIIQASKNYVKEINTLTNYLDTVKEGFSSTSQNTIDLFLTDGKSARIGQGFEFNSSDISSLANQLNIEETEIQDKALELIQAIFGAVEEKYVKAVNNSNIGEEEAKKARDLLYGTTIDNYTNYINKLITFSNIGGQEGTSLLNTLFEKSLSTATTQEDRDAIIREFTSADFSTTSGINQFINNLRQIGISFPFEEQQNYIKQLIELGNATANIDLTNLLAQTKGLRDAADDIRNRETAEGITQEEYDLIAGTNKFDMSQFSWTGQEWIYLGDSMQQLADKIVDISNELSIEGAAADTTNNEQLAQEALIAKGTATDIRASTEYSKEQREQAIKTIVTNKQLASTIELIKTKSNEATKSLNNYEDLVIDLAIATDKAQEKFGDFNSKITESYEAIKNPEDNQAYLEAINQIAEQASNVFGQTVNADVIIENLDDIIDIVEGEGGEKTVKAYRRLAQKIYQETLNELGQLEDGTQITIDGIVSYIESQNPNLEFGGTFDASEIFNKFAETREEAYKLQQILTSLGYITSNKLWFEYEKDGLVGYAQTTEGINYLTGQGYTYKGVVANSTTATYTPPEKTKTPKITGGSGKSSGSTSEWKNPYDKQYNTIEQINEELRKREVLEKNFQRLQDQGKSTALLTLDYYNKLYKNLEGQLPLQEKLLEGRREELADLVKKNTQYAKYGSYDEATGLIQIDWDLIDSIKKTDTKTGEAVENYISEFERIAGSIEDVKGEILDIKQQQQDIKQELTDAFLSFEERVANAMEAAAQKDIDAMQEEFDALTEAEEALADAISKSIDEMRQARENEKTEDEIAEKERRLAYLRQDTTGSNALEIKRLEEEIAEQREEYQDALVDQALTNLQAQNEAAAEQRERQIELAQSQLEYNVENGVYVKQVAGLIESAMEGDHMLTKDDKLYEILHKGEDWSKLSEAGFQEMFRNLGIELNKAFSKLKADFAQDEDLTQFSGDYMAEMIRRYNENGGILTQDILELNDLRNDKIEDPNYTGSQETLTPAELEEILKQHYTGSSNSGTSNSGTNTTGTTKTYTVKAGDSLSKIARDELGDMNRWKEIASLNGISSPYTIYPNQKLKLPAYKTGGIADFTGPAWLDGSKSKPELILNARDTENFIMLKDILSGVLNNASNIKSKSGDNYFDIDIQVDEIANDYDVDQMAERIKQNIYEDSTYRNVNAINLLR